MPSTNQTFTIAKRKIATLCALCRGHGQPHESKNDALAAALRDGWQSRILGGAVAQVCWECSRILDQNDPKTTVAAHGSRDGQPCPWGAPKRGQKPIKRLRP